MQVTRMGVRPGRRWARGGVGKGDDTAADERTVGEGARTDERRCYGERQADKKISEWGICFFVYERDGPAPAEPRPDESHRLDARS